MHLLAYVSSEDGPDIGMEMVVVSEGVVPTVVSVMHNNDKI